MSASGQYASEIGPRVGVEAAAIANDPNVLELARQHFVQYGLSNTAGFDPSAPKVGRDFAI